MSFTQLALIILRGFVFSHPKPAAQSARGPVPTVKQGATPCA